MPHHRPPPDARLAARRGRQARLALLAAAVGNGLTYPAIHLGVSGYPPPLFVAVRFMLAAVVLLPWAWRGLRAPGALRSGAGLGLIEGSVGALVAVNIGHMPASRCAFIMGTSVVLVPLWAAVFRMQRLTWKDGGRSCLSLVGLFVLTGSELAHLGGPELAILAAAALWALNIVLIKRQTQRHPIPPASLAFYQALCNALVPWALVVWGGIGVRAPGLATWAALAYCALVATVMNLLIQARFQKHTTSTQAALRLSLEPVFATLAAYLALGDRVTWGTVLGGGLMLTATLLDEIQRWWARRGPPRASRAQGGQIGPSSARS